MNNSIIVGVSLEIYRDSGVTIHSSMNDNSPSEKVKLPTGILPTGFCASTVFH